MRRYIFAVIVTLVALFQSCITNDVPYPEVDLYITSVKGEGFTLGSIDNATKRVTIILDETTDITKVTIDEVEITPGAELLTNVVGGRFDMRLPLSVVLSLYDECEWRIVAEQSIERRFKVEGQIGEEVIDPEKFTARVYVSEDTDLTNIKVTDLKLGPHAITQMTPSISELTNFETVRHVYISYHDREERWKLYVEPTEVKVMLSQCDVWAKRAYLTAQGDTSLECGFSYREQGATDWIDVNKEDVIISSGQFTTTLNGLTPDTNYEFRASVGDNISAVISKQSESVMPLVNGGFEEWNKDSKVWYPFLDEVSRYWDTGNKGATTLGEDYNLTTPLQEDIRPGSKGAYSAKLQSRNVLVKFAAGNLFVGRYVKTAVTNGIVGFGQPFTSRPTALRGWVKYNCGTIDIIGETPPGVEIVKNETKDSGSIFIALGTWTPEEYGVSSRETEMLGTEQTPIIVDTRDKNTFFNPKAKAVTAYGEMIFTESVGEWTEFTIPLSYNSMSEIPSTIVLVCSASRYGDYFTGSTQSMMLLDDFELIYE